MRKPANVVSAVCTEYEPSGPAVAATVGRSGNVAGGGALSRMNQYQIPKPTRATTITPPTITNLRARRIGGTLGRRLVPQGSAHQAIQAESCVPTQQANSCRPRRRHGYTRSRM